MPYDANGVWSLTAGYLAVTGQVVSPTNHNPPLEDISTNGLSAVLVRDGRAPMTGNLNMGTTNKITNLANGTAAADAVNKSQLDASVASLSSRGFLWGLTLSNNGADAVNDIDIAAGSAADETASPWVVMTLAASLTKRLDAAWAVGTNQGGLDTGAIANTTYHVWLIQRSDTGVVDALFSTSATSPTMPTNYDRKRRIGAIIRESAAIVAFVQVGDYFYRSVRTSDVSATNPGTSAVTRTLSVPTGIVVTAFGQSQILTSTTSTTFALLLTSLSQADTDPGSLGGDTVVTTQSTAGNYRGSSIFYTPTNTSAQIRSRLSPSNAATTVSIFTEGWIDTRGRT